jgi:2,5-diamino-6-(ribosylamino)-4(3H)-pyrimidinone 5'-phosphate reductase
MRPFTFINVATTVDGKLAPANRKFVPFGSRRDLQMLYELRAASDAVIVGARTIDSAPGHYGPGPPRYRRLRLRRGLAEHNLRVIVSGAGTLNPRADIFRHRFSPIVVLVSGRAPLRNLLQLEAVADEVKVFGEDQLDFVAAFHWLRESWKVKRLLSEGGGELNFALLRLGLVDEIHQTVCPLILGGRNAPTLADGVGFNSAREALRVRLKSVKQSDDELFLVYRVVKKSLPEDGPKYSIKRSKPAPLAASDVRSRRLRMDVESASSRRRLQGSSASPLPTALLLRRTGRWVHTE